MSDLGTFAIEHGTALVALATGVTALVRARARLNVASAAAVEQLTEEHARCTAALKTLTTRVDDVEAEALAAKTKADENEALAAQLNDELRRLMQEIQR